MSALPVDSMKLSSVVATDGFAAPKKSPGSIAVDLYPHPDLPLLPDILVALAGSRSVIGLDGQSHLLASFSKRRPSDFSSEELAHICDQISDVVQTLLYSRKSLSHLGVLRIDVPDDLRLVNLALSDRARVALQTRSFFDPMGQWRHCNLLAMVSTHAMGAKLTMAFLLAVEDGLIRHRSRLLSKDCLEDDLLQVIQNSLYASRSADVFAKANGWDGGSERSLTEISHVHGVSKERARQILALSNSSMDRHLVGATPPASLVTALRILTSKAPMTTQAASQSLIDAGLTRGPFHPAGVINASKRHGLPIEIEVHKLPDGGEIVLDPELISTLNQLRPLAKSMARSWGVVHAKWLFKQGQDAGLSVTVPLAQLALDCEPQLLSLESCGPWYWPGSDIRPSGAIVRSLKIIAFFGQASTACFDEDLRGSGAKADLNLPEPLPKTVLISLLRAWGMAEDAQGNWSAATELAKSLCANALPAVEKEIADLIASSKEPVNKTMLKTLAQDHGINANTLQSYLRRSALIAPMQERMGIVRLIDPGLGANVAQMQRDRSM